MNKKIKSWYNKFYYIVIAAFCMHLLFLTGCQLMKSRHKEAENHYEYGMLYLQNGKYNLAHQQFQKARELNPKDYRIYNGFGLIYYFQGKPALAIEEYQKAIDLNPQYPDAFNNLAAALAKQEKWLKVIEYADKALANASYMTPEFAHYNKGIAYYNLKDYEKAREEFETSLELDPNYIDTHYQLGLTQLKLELYPEASQSFQKVLQLMPVGEKTKTEPLFIESRYYLGLSYFYRQKKDQAAKEFQKVIDIAPESNWAKEAQKYLNEMQIK